MNAPGLPAGLNHDARRATGIIKVLLAEDMNLLRSALVNLLSQEQGIDVVGAQSCTPPLFQMALRLRPDVIVIDVGLPCKSGLSLVRDLRRRLPQAQLVAPRACVH